MVMAEDNKKESPYFLPKSDINPDGQIKGAGEWIKMDQPGSFINNLDTIKVDPSARSSVFNALIAGVPSPWARAKITYFALKTDDTNEDPRALMSCYRALRDEWRGLIATLVCRADQFYLSKPIKLPHFDSDELIDIRPDEIDILSTYGDMLFEETDLWYISEPMAGRHRSPSIQLLYFIDQGQKKLVGATSPFSVFFTAVNYDIKNANGITGISDLGKFDDPTKDTHPNEEQKKSYRKIYAFLDRLRSNLTSYRKALDTITQTNAGAPGRFDDEVKDIYETLQNEIDSWARQIARNLGEKEVDMRARLDPLNLNAGIIPAGPLSRLFANNQKYIWDGSQFVNAAGEDAQALDIDSLFTESNVLTAWRPVDSWVERYEKAPVHYLRTKDENGKVVFMALPLSPKGVNLFGKHISSILNGTNPNVSITAEVKGKVVDVRLNMIINDQLSGQKHEAELLLKTYTMIPGSTDHHVFTWPNFKSAYWNQYFYYSELPTNMTNTTRAVPEFEGKEFGRPKKEGEEYPADKAPGIEEVKAVEGVVYKVTYPMGKVGADKHCYEVISSDTPLAYLTLVASVDGQDQISGRLLVKVDVEGSASMHEITGRPQYQAYVGIDFGSTNTCAFYRIKGQTDTHPLPFSNMRLAILNFDNAPGMLAEPNELLFIANEEPVNNNGQVKSWLHRHSPEYIESAKRNEAIVGGIPVNETNITVVDMNDTEITTNAGKLCYNMKWLTGEAGEDRNSFLRMIWLHITADLFRMGIEPIEIRWSYPGAKQNSDIQTVFGNCTFYPHDGENKKVKDKSFTESEAVCRYAGRPGGTTPEDDRLVLGIDIGGSTSDILILGKEPGGAPRLYSQCSVRLAAGKFFSAIKNSESFRRALVNFHNSDEIARFKKVPVYGIDILSQGANKERAPYFLNNIFDRLNKEESGKMYKFMRGYVPFVFTLPAFVTGLLCYYSGEMLRSVIIKNGMQERIREIKVQYFGKGGRLFEWLHEVEPAISTQYLTACLYNGMGEMAKGKSIEFRWPEEGTENKTEVAQGLVLMGEGQRYLGIANDTAEEGASGAPNLGVFGQGMFGGNGFNFAGSAAAQPEADDKKDTADRSDIIGEKGIRYFKDGAYHELSDTDVLNLKINQLNFSECKMQNFTQFINLFCTYLMAINAITDQSQALQLFQDVQKIEIGNFLSNDADNESSETSHMPIFVAEGLYYLERVLLPTIFKK